MLEPLTEKQKIIYEFLKSEIRKKGYPPAIREICNAVGLSSTSTVHSHLTSLEVKGYIKKNPTKYRSIEILEDGFYNDSLDYVDVPVVGEVGSIVGVATNDVLPIRYSYTNGSNCFMIRITDECPNTKGILKGDLVLISPDRTVKNGHLIAISTNNSIEIKIYNENNSKLTSIDKKGLKNISNNMVLGQVIGMYRDYRK